MVELESRNIEREMCLFICGALMKCVTGLLSHHYVVSLLNISGNFFDTLFGRCFQVGCKKNFTIKHTICFISQNCNILYIERGVGREGRGEHHNSLLFIDFARM